MKTTLSFLKDNLWLEGNSMKHVDQHHFERIFSLRDMVFVFLQLYKKTTIQQLGKNKLQPKFYGPYIVWEKIGEVSYVLYIFNKGYSIMPFHICYLKKNLSNEVVTKMETHLTDEKGKTILELEGILEVKGINLCSRKIRVQDQMEGPLGKGGHVEVESMVEHSSLNML
jgi:hypothetical protein